MAIVVPVLADDLSTLRDSPGAPELVKSDKCPNDFIEAKQIANSEHILIINSHILLSRPQLLAANQGATFIVAAGPIVTASPGRYIVTREPYLTMGPETFLTDWEMVKGKEVSPYRVATFTMNAANQSNKVISDIIKDTYTSRRVQFLAAHVGVADEITHGKPVIYFHGDLYRKDAERDPRVLGVRVPEYAQSMTGPKPTLPLPRDSGSDPRVSLPTPTRSNVIKTR